MDYESIQNLHAGDHFNFKGLEWVVLDPNKEGGVLAITADIWKRNVPFNQRCFDGCNNWRGSILRNDLSELKQKIGVDNLLPHTVDLVADNGDKLYGTLDEMVFLLTCDECRKYRDVMPKYDSWIWTCTPWTAVSTGVAHIVRGVSFDGSLNDFTANNGYGGVAQACIFDPRHLKLRLSAQFVESPTQDD
jgi:hypothetical protein